mmetsp:Transcript_40114/g.115761  ORF Transcript_40114/g.115761 Transcript_40114/m.115761 type:complete len:219 (-) Transcript_40114:810-1466(-)
MSQARPNRLAVMFRAGSQGVQARGSLPAMSAKPKTSFSAIWHGSGGGRQWHRKPEPATLHLLSGPDIAYGPFALGAVLGRLPRLMVLGLLGSRKQRQRQRPHPREGRTGRQRARMRRPPVAGVRTLAQTASICLHPPGDHGLGAKDRSPSSLPESRHWHPWRCLPRSRLQRWLLPSAAARRQRQQCWPVPWSPCRRRAGRRPWWRLQVGSRGGCGVYF